MDQMDWLSEDLCIMLLELFGKHIAQPRRDLYEKATGLPVNPGKPSHGFLTEQEAESDMVLAQQQDLFQQHVAAIAPRAQLKKPRGRGGGKGGGGNRLPGGLRNFW